MFRTKAQTTIASLVLGAACMVAPSAWSAVQGVPLAGGIAGTVRDAAGQPQMGAAVLLINHQERVIERVLTNERGEFKLLGLLPNLYSVKVTLASFVPALKKDILVQPGMRSVLNVSLNTLFSSIHLSYPTIENGSIMSDDWKWVLRSASPTRPVMRLLDPDEAEAATGAAAGPSGEKVRAAVFSGTHAIVKVSAGDSALADLSANEAGLGTAFALATSVYGANNLQVSGNVGYGPQTGAPATAFRTSFRRNVAGGDPEVSLTMRQLYMPGRFAAAVTGQDSGLPALRTMSAGVDDHTQIGDNLRVQYGFALDCVSFLDHLNYFSPYARLTYELSEGSEMEFAYTSGNARPDLGGSAGDEEDLQRGLNTLALFPRVSMLGGQSKVQRGQEYEIGYSRKVGSRTYQVSAYSESVSNLALSMVSPAGFFSGVDVLPDLFSGNSIFNAGTFDSVGYSGAVIQNFGDHVSATVIYGSTGALTTNGHELVSNSPDELRSMIHAGRRQAATTRLNATVPWTGTHLVASYQWAAGGDQHWVEPGNLYSTRSQRPLPGFNIHIRQPIPGFGGRIEATADLRNLLAQGYLGINTAQGQQILLVENPRSVRGGLSFVF
jgi:carboxypeptidase family protein